MEQMALTLYPKEPAFRVCVNIVIVDDLKVEKTEQFILELTSDDEDISILIPKAIVLIEDDDCKFSHIFQSCYICNLLFCHSSTLLTF